MFSRKNIHNIKFIFIVILCLFLFTDIIYGLAPSSRFNPICEVVRHEDGSHEIVVDEEGQRFQDEETVRSVRAGETLGRSFRNRVAFRDISMIIGQCLHLGISEETLIQDIKSHVNKAELAMSKYYDDALLAGYEIDELHYDEEERAYCLPVYREGFRVFHYKYYIDKRPDKEPDMTLPLGDGTEVYVRAEPVESKDLASRTTLYRLFTKPLFTITDRVLPEPQKVSDLKPEKDVSKNLRFDKRVEVFQGEVAIVELEDGEELMTENLQVCSAFLGRGKRKDGRNVYVLAHLVDLKKEEQMELLTQTLREQSLREIEIYVNGPAKNEEFFQVRLAKLKTELPGTKIILDKDRNAWRSVVSQTPGRATLKMKNFIYEHRYDKEKSKEKIAHWWRSARGRSADIKETLGYGPDAPDPSIETSIHSDSYGYHDIIRTAKAIYQQGEVGQRFRYLLREIIAGRAVIQPPGQAIMRDLNKEEDRIAGFFKEVLEPHYGKPWYGEGAPDISSLILLDYIYFLADLSVEHCQTGSDPYIGMNMDRVKAGREYLQDRWDAIKADDTEVETLEHMLKDILYGNKYEGAMDVTEKELRIISDHRRQLAKLILSVGPEGILDLFVDNVGPELAANLRLVDCLVRDKKVRKVRIHIKPAPFVISDVWGTEDDPMQPYIAATLENFRKFGGKELEQMADRLEGFISDKKVELKRDEFLTYKADFMEAAEELNETLSDSSCAIFIGEYLYRKLLGHRRWPHTEDPNVLDYILNYIKVPVGIIRMVKSDIKLGIPADTPADGTIGTVQVKLVNKEYVYPTPGTEERHAKNFSDRVKCIQAKEDDRPVILALGTGWIKGYEKGRYLQYDALNPLITSIREFCKEKGITFVDRDDAELLDAIEKAKDGRTNARVIVLAGQETVESPEFKALREDMNNFLVGVNNEELTVDSYMRLMEMMTLTLNLAFDREVDLDNPNIIIRKHNKFPNIYIFIPKAEPMDYEILKEIYKIQTFA